MGAWSPLWVESRGLETIVVRGGEDVAFDYQVNGVRRGYSGVETIVPNSSYVPRYRDLPFGTQYPAEIQRMLIENGILNPDLTPNEATAGRLGWTLLDADRAPHRAFSARAEKE